jgi:hypothetical protein
MTTIEDAASRAEGLLRRAGFSPRGVSASYQGLEVVLASQSEADRVSRFFEIANMSVVVEPRDGNYVALASW